MDRTAPLTQPPVDLTNCDREPIHVPGAVQPHGFLLAFSEPELRITHASENVATFLGVAARDLLGKDFPEITAPIRASLSSASFSTESTRTGTSFRAAVGAKRFEGTLHRFDGRLIAELEPTQSAEADYHELYLTSRESISQLRSSNTLEELYRAAVTVVRKLTGFDRVLIYKFDPLWNGHVLAEAKAEKTDSYLDLHFPASDIPRQARELYRLNRVRTIATVEYAPSRILAASGETRPLDLSFSALRSVSPIHIEYLRNMGASASMSISLLKEGKLWGLISCTHESGPLILSFETRAVCDLFGEVMSSLLTMRSEAEIDSQVGRTALLQTRLLEAMSKEDDFVVGLSKNETEFLEIVGAKGAAIFSGGNFRVMGHTPETADLQSLVGWLSAQPSAEVYSTNSLPSLLTGASEFKDVGCGLLAFPISRAQTTYIMWFRPEVVQTLKWGGDPTKPVQGTGSSAVLHPRKSFEAWKQTVTDRSQPWSEAEIQAALKLRSSIIDSVIRKMERISLLNRELERSNTELDSFAYAASHDLKEPLRGIHNYAAILMKSLPEKLSTDERSRLETIGRLTQRMEDLINSLLSYAQVGRAELAMRKTDLNDVVKTALESLKSRIEDSHVDIEVESKLPGVVGDRAQLVEVFTNLISNAIKYNDNATKKVEVGAVEARGAKAIYVRDNGIGIEAENHSRIFKIFKRLHGKDKYGGGTGTGLTITEKIIERHGGQLWLESAPGAGTTFYFTLGDRA